MDPRTHGPRERLAGEGTAALTDRELLTLVLAPGSRQVPGDLLAARVLDHWGTIRRLPGRRPAELANLSGLGHAKACRLLAALELGRRSLEPDADAGPLSGAADVYQRFRSMARDANEAFVAVSVNSRNRVRDWWVVARGWESGVNLVPRQVFQLLTKEGAGRVIFVHNHPSGDPTPSPTDVRFTARLLSAARTLDIQVLDHIVVASGGYASLREMPGTNLEFG